MDKITIQVQWTCDSGDRCNNPETPGMHTEERFAAKCVYQDDPKAFFKWMDENHCVPAEGYKIPFPKKTAEKK